jgi:imidazole glycerol-phosphate synthase subunit HisH
MNIGIIDYGIGNLNSIKNMIEFLEFDCEIISENDCFEPFSKIILPGVGSFDSAMAKINMNLNKKIQNFANKEKYILGICLGAHLLGKGSEEGSLKGLGLIPMTVTSFNNVGLNANIGWRTIQNPFPKNFTQKYYHLHNYFMKLEHLNETNIEFEYSENEDFEFVTGIKYKNIIAVQYHPEKSNNYGKAFFKWFCEL